MGAAGPQLVELSRLEGALVIPLRVGDGVEQVVAVDLRAVLTGHTAHQPQPLPAIPAVQREVPQRRPGAAGGAHHGPIGDGVSSVVPGGINRDHVGAAVDPDIVGVAGAHPRVVAASSGPVRLLRFLRLFHRLLRGCLSLRQLQRRRGMAFYGRHGGKAHIRRDLLRQLLSAAAGKHQHRRQQQGHGLFFHGISPILQIDGMIIQHLSENATSFLKKIVLY